MSPKLKWLYWFFGLLTGYMLGLAVKGYIELRTAAHVIACLERLPGSKERCYQITDNSPLTKALQVISPSFGFTERAADTYTESLFRKD